MTTPTPLPERPGLLRLRLVGPGGAGRLDGGWWPRSRDLSSEVAHLLDQLPGQLSGHQPDRLGPVTHVRYCAADWDEGREGAPPDIGGLLVQAGVLGGADAHTVELGTAVATTLRLLVVPPAFDEADGEEALLAASTHGNAHSAVDLLATVSEADDVDPSGHWRYDGGAGWGQDATSSTSWGPSGPR